MALADSVPGVSGGTIAYLLGYYEEFINSLNSFLTAKGDKSERKNNIKKSVKFLLKLGIGWIVGFIAAVLILTSVFESHIYQVSSLFIGFIVFSIPLIVYEEKESLKKFYNVIFLLLGVALVAVITMANPSDGGMVSDGSVNFVQLLYIAFVGMIAISAMVLPGISGSTMLLIFGIFLSVLGILNIKGDISTIHSYNRRKVKEEDIPKYGKAVGTGTVIMGASLILAYFVTFWNEAAIDYIIFPAITIGLAFILYGQIKYNHGIF